MIAAQLGAKFRSCCFKTPCLASWNREEGWKDTFLESQRTFASFTVTIRKCSSMVLSLKTYVPDSRKTWANLKGRSKEGTGWFKLPLSCKDSQIHRLEHSKLWHFHMLLTAKDLLILWKTHSPVLPVTHALLITPDLTRRCWGESPGWGGLAFGRVQNPSLGCCYIDAASDKQGNGWMHDLGTVQHSVSNCDPLQLPVLTTLTLTDSWHWSSKGLCNCISFIGPCSVNSFNWGKHYRPTKTYTF